MRKLLVLAGIAGLLGLSVLVPVGIAGQPAPSTLNQARPEGFTCRTVGGGTICQYSHVETFGPEDIGITCGSGAGAFDIFDHFVNRESGTVWFDENGNLTKFTDKDVYSFGQWSNPTTGATVSYTQREERTYVLAVPGDFTSAIVTVTGENIYRTGTGAPVLLAVGRQVYNFDQSELLSSHAQTRSWPRPMKATHTSSTRSAQHSEREPTSLELALLGPYLRGSLRVLRLLDPMLARTRLFPPVPAGRTSWNGTASAPSSPRGGLRVPQPPRSSCVLPPHDHGRLRLWVINGFDLIW